MADKYTQQQSNDSKNLQIAKSPAAIAELNVSQMDETNISEVKKLSLIRDTYKRKTQTFLDDGLNDMLDKNKQSKLQKVKELRQLVDTNKCLLSQLHNQRASYDKRVGELVKLCRSFGKANEDTQKEKEAAAKSLESTADSIKRQLDELKKTLT